MDNFFSGLSDKYWMFSRVNNSFRRLYFYFFVVCFFIPAQFLRAEQISTPAALKIYVNSSVVDQHYTLADMRAIFAMRKTRWHNGEKIQVFVLPDNNPLHHQFIRTNFNMFAHQFRRIWDRLIFSGTGQAPSEVISLEQMQQKIANTPGAIGYIKTPVNYEKIRPMNYE